MGAAYNRHANAPQVKQAASERRRLPLPFQPRDGCRQPCTVTAAAKGRRGRPRSTRRALGRKRNPNARKIICPRRLPRAARSPPDTARPKPCANAREGHRARGRRTCAVANGGRLRKRQRALRAADGSPRSSVRLRSQPKREGAGPLSRRPLAQGGHVSRDPMPRLWPHSTTAECHNRACSTGTDLPEGAAQARPRCAPFRPRIGIGYPSSVLPKPRSCRHHPTIISSAPSLAANTLFDLGII